MSFLAGDGHAGSCARSRRSARLKLTLVTPKRASSSPLKGIESRTETCRRIVVRRLCRVARLKSSGLLSPERISFFVTVTVAASSHAALDLDEPQSRRRPVSWTRCRSPGCCAATPRARDRGARSAAMTAIDRESLDPRLAQLRRASGSVRARWPRALEEPAGTTSAPPTTTGGSGESWRLLLELLEPPLEPRCSSSARWRARAEFSRRAACRPAPAP